jgi:Heparinase II/III-like protein/Heparinase II/III N-terminus
VSSAWQRKWSRLTHTSWEELRTRVSQAATKRLALAAYHAGIEIGEQPLRPRPAAARFFFGNGADNAVYRATLLRTHLPLEADAIIREGDDICRHTFRVLGYEKLNYGPEIDWHFDPVHNKRSPLKPWFKIDFLDFQTVGDHKIIWELNRHQHLVTLAKAWCLTGNRAYATELAQQWYSWQKANPYPLGINWASTLEVAFRSVSWLWVLNLLAGCADIPPSFRTDLLLALQAHGRYIERYLSTYFSPNTHLLGEVMALFFIGTLCPEISAAERWRNMGWKILIEEAGSQVRTDGVYFEQALYYHVYALDFFLHARHLAGENGFEIPDTFDAVIKKMLDVVQSLSEAGPPEGFGDDDGGRVFNPRRNRIECMTDSLALGSVMYDCQYREAPVTEEAIWLFGEKAIAAIVRPRLQKGPASKAFPSGGIYLINDDAPFPQQLMIDAGPQGTGRSGHGHADALSIRFSLNERRFLIDPGTYCYEGDARNHFRGTAAHNTLRIDEVDQALPDGLFAWTAIPDVKAETWLNGQTFDFFTGSHNGYRRLSDPVTHRRAVFHVSGGLWFVHDVAGGAGVHLLESFWHFAPDVRVKNEHGILLADPVTVDSTTAPGLALLTVCNSAWKTEITEGLVSPVYGLKQVAPVVRATLRTKLPEDCGVLLLPRTASTEIGTLSALDDGPVSQVHGYRYQTPHGAELLFFCYRNVPWACGPWASDASLLYCKLERNRFAHVIMVSGSFAEWRGKRFVSHPPGREHFEWSNRTGLENSPANNVLDALAITDF